ncbi:MAG: hypothetical protein RR145_05035, partial [Oscillospiraceae bacterium]
MIYVFLVSIAFFMCYFTFIPFRLAVKNPVKSVVNGCIDMYIYIKEKRYNVCPSGSICAYVSLSDKVFGNGKTLSCVHEVCMKYKQFNNKMVWDNERKEFVQQKIHVIANVKLNDIPYEHMASL